MNTNIEKINLQIFLRKKRYEHSSKAHEILQYSNNNLDESLNSDLSTGGNYKLSGGGKNTASSSNKKKLSIEDFEIQGVLGEGSYGKVYCAIHKSENKAYAIKVLDKYHIMKVSIYHF